MNLSKTRLGAGAFAIALAAAVVAPMVGALPASAASCTSPVRYAASTNTIYLVARRSYTLSSIKRACPGAPVSMVDRKRKIWQLNADLVVQNGSTLKLHGSRARGDVDHLRLRSRTSNKPTEVSQVMAKAGVIDMRWVRVTSWDDRTGRPDTNPNVSGSGSGSGSDDESLDLRTPEVGTNAPRGRAFIRAISYLDAGGRAHNSTMHIHNSDLSYLGFAGAESYGVSYKARGCDRAHLAACGKVRVYGSQSHTRFHHNYIGTYAWGAKSMTFRHNTYDHNISYGLDPHDVSTDLVIDRNRFAYNGNHGMICSQRCERLRITNNESDHNGRKPWRGKGSRGAGQVHGIMIHRGVTRSLIAGNKVHDQYNGVGIAVFDSAHNMIVGNTLWNNAVGIRLSVGASKNTFRKNVIRHSKQHAILFFPGKDRAAYSTRSGRPTGNVFVSNLIQGSRLDTMRIVDSDRNRFQYTTVSGRGGPILFAGSVGSVLDRVRLPRGQRIAVTSAAGRRSSLYVSDPPGCRPVRLDSGSTCAIVGKAKPRP